MPHPIMIEVCANSVESALAAQKGGAHRVELCDNLYEGGTTPSAGSIREARHWLSIGLNPIIRPRGGDFCYSDLEFTTIKHDIQFAKDAGCDGVVIGILTPEGRIDIPRTAELVQLAYPMSVTFHRAFDMTENPKQALVDLMNIGVDRILTSGKKNKALDGTDLLRELVQASNGHTIIMPGSGINETNIAKMISNTGAREYHVSCRKVVQSQMDYRNPDVFMGGLPDIPEYETSVTDVERIRQVVSLANG